MTLEYPPSDPATTADMLMQQMDSLCHDIVELQELVNARRRREGNGPSASDGLGDFAPLTARCIEAADTIAGIFGQKVLPAHAPPTANWWEELLEAGNEFRAKLLPACYGILKWGVKILCFLLFISCILAFVVDQDLIDPYVDKYLGESVTERLIVAVRDNWQIPLQREFRCVTTYAPIFRSKRSRVWEVLYSTVLQSHKECDREKSFILNAHRYVTCVGATPRPSWMHNPCRR